MSPDPFIIAAAFTIAVAAVLVGLWRQRREIEPTHPGRCRHQFVVAHPAPAEPELVRCGEPRRIHLLHMARDSGGHLRTWMSGESYPHPSRGRS